MFFKSRWFQLCVAIALGVVVLLLPRPEGTKFKITGEDAREFVLLIDQHFSPVSDDKTGSVEYIVKEHNLYV